MKNQPLGTGSYGAICKARCDELLCAAKIIHPTLFLDDPGARNIPLEKFQQECRLLCAVKHPNIVQYLGTCREPDTGHLVLLMELCHESLTGYLKNSSRTIPHFQVSLCHDIALALVYLHTNGLIHRDLSSNNILLMKDHRAKITDFGMSRFMQVNHQLTPLTLCPGTQAYMPPESLEEPPQYTPKLDCFSFGVLAIQIITREFPDPGPRFQTISDPRYPLGVRLPVLEEEQRKSHISMIESSHTMLPIMKKCLSYKEQDRPTAVQLCKSVAELKNTALFEESMQASVQICHVVESSIPLLQPSDRTTDEEESSMNDASTDIKALQDKLQQAESRQRELENLLHTSHERVNQRDNDLKKKLTAMQRTLSSTQSELEAISDKQSEVLTTQIPKQNSRGLPLFTWEITGVAPQELFRGGAVVLGDSIYCLSSGKRAVLKFDISTKAWSFLPQCRYSHFSLAVVSGQLTAIGGYDFTTTDQLFTFAPEGEGAWVRQYGSMPTARCSAVSVCTDSSLIVAGGDASGYNDYLDVVEVMDIGSGKWTAVSKLPLHQLNLSGAITSNGCIYLAGGIAVKGKNVIYSCSVSDLLLPPPRAGRFRALSQPKRPPVWHEASSLPVTQTTLVAFNDHLLAIGGQNSDRKPVTNVYLYDEENNSWKEFGSLNVPQSRCLTGVTVV